MVTYLDGKRQQPPEATTCRARTFAYKTPTGDEHDLRDDFDEMELVMEHSRSSSLISSSGLATIPR